MRKLVCDFDPYDLWASGLGVSIRRRYYRGQITGKIGAVGIGLLDWLFPRLSRKLIGVVPTYYPIVVAHQILLADLSSEADPYVHEEALDALAAIASQKGGESGWSWGLGFAWMSKNGLYGPDIPFVTHTPYVMEALLALAEKPALYERAMDMFHGTWIFLESLKVMEENGEALALSYAPVDEPRIVVNANSYAAFAYALHAVHGGEGIRELARHKSFALAQWVVNQQQGNGAWNYYADEEPGNFIDCFHSCFVVKNLLKAKGLLPELAPVVDSAVERGWSYIRSELYDSQSGLCRRFAVRSHQDPFRWDLYDQAEFLGLLVDFEEWALATEFAQGVERRFRKGDGWYCRIDILGRRWGRNFLRWGIVPFWYHRARLACALDGSA